MKNAWKWIAIVLAVVLVGAIVLPFFGGWMHGGGYASYGRMPMMGGWNENLPRGGEGFAPWHGPMMRGGWGTGGRGMMPPFFFGGGWMVLLALAPLGLLGLAAWGVVALVRRGKPATAPAAAVTAQAAAPAARVCAACGQALEEPWGFCPACGEKV